MNNMSPLCVKHGWIKLASGRNGLPPAKKALAGPLSITLPHRVAEYLPPSEPSALAYGLDLRRGERFLLDIDLHSAEPLTLFVDLFRVGEHGMPQRIVSLKPGDRRLEFEPDEDNMFILRLQPELLRGGRVTLTQRVQAALMFPVPGRGRSNIHSFFGAARQSGDREHQGIDIFAARGTPAVAAADALVTSAPFWRTSGRAPGSSNRAVDE